MKKILFFSLIFACLFSFGKCNKHKKCCKKKATTETSSAKLNKNEVWMKFDATKCANPWKELNWFQKPTKEQLLGAIKNDLIGQEIDVLEIRTSSEKDFISCEACTCPSGNYYFVRVNKSEIEKLKALKFYEIKDFPNVESIDNTK